MSDSQRALWRSFSRSSWRALVGIAILLLGGSSRAAAEDPGDGRPGGGTSPRRVLILSSFGTDMPLFNQVASTLRAELIQGWREPFDIYDLALEHAGAEDDERQAPFLEYLSALFATRPLSLVVTLGGPAARFAHRHRERLFPGIPLLYAAVDVRVLDPSKLLDHDAHVPVDNDIPGTVESFLRLAPETERLVVVVGNSPLERFWRGEIGRSLKPYEGRLHLEWTDRRSLPEVSAQVAALPPRSAVFFVLLLVDGVGVPHSQGRALTAVAQAASAPVFALFDTQIGQGVVGGRVLSVEELGERTAAATSRLLRGEAPASVRYPPLRPARFVYDERELARWHISHRRLPPGSEVRFVRHSLWSTYRWPIVGVLALVGLETALIVGLVAQRTRRRAAEQEVRALHGSLLTTYEQERSRLARELHDDVTQRLARLAIDAAQLERQRPVLGDDGIATQMRRDLVQLTDDVQALSRRLHPSVLDDLGLAEALRSETERFSAAQGLMVVARVDGEPPELAPEVALCLYRVAQESLRNVARHSGASRVEISLTRKQSLAELAVRDDGKGFDPEAARSGGGLGLISLRERLHLVGGRLAVISAPGRGTTIVAWAPLAEAAS